MSWRLPFFLLSGLAGPAAATDIGGSSELTLVYAAAGIAVAALLLFIWNLLLRHQVARRTGELHAERDRLRRLSHEREATLNAIPDLLSKSMKTVATSICGAIQTTN